MERNRDLNSKKRSLSILHVEHPFYFFSINDEGNFASHSIY